MKKLISVFVCCMLFAAAGSAQVFEKGQIFINPSLTNLGFNSLNLKYDGGNSISNSRFGFQAAGGYAIKPNIAIEAGLGFQSLDVDSTPLSEFNIFAGARYYILKSFYANADLSFLSGKGEVVSGNTSKFKATCLKVGAGYDYFLSKKFAIEPSISYLFSLSAKVGEHDLTLGLFSINLGFIYLF